MYILIPPDNDPFIIVEDTGPEKRGLIKISTQPSPSGKGRRVLCHTALLSDTSEVRIIRDSKGGTRMVGQTKVIALPSTLTNLAKLTALHTEGGPTLTHSKDIAIIISTEFARLRESIGARHGTRYIEPALRLYRWAYEAGLFL